MLFFSSTEADTLHRDLRRKEIANGFHAQLDLESLLRVNNSRSSKASGAAVPERIAAKPTSNDSSTPDNGRNSAGQIPAEMCH
jgi:hypothetical protein